MSAEHRWGRIDVFTFSNGSFQAYHHVTDHDENPPWVTGIWLEHKYRIFEEGKEARIFHVYDTELDWEEAKELQYFARVVSAQRPAPSAATKESGDQ